MDWDDPGSRHERAGAFLKAMSAAWVALALIFGAAGALFAEVVQRWLGRDVWEEMAVVTVLIAPLLGAIGFAYSEDRETLRRSWKTGGRCGVCGYDLRATPERCPECGTERRCAEGPAEVGGLEWAWRRAMRGLEWVLGGKSERPGP